MLLFATYLLLGPLFWLALATLAAFGRSRMSRLHRNRGSLSEPPPTLSIVVPARDEADGIRACVDRILKQDYPGFEIVVVDDRSTDGTGDILDEIAAHAPRVRPFHVKHLPKGWLGKCHALYVGTQGLDSEWLLFVDSDVQLAFDAARRAVALADGREYDALSVMTALIAPTFWERTLLPILAMAWGAAFQISLTNDDSLRGHAFANGQFFLIRRAWYEKIRGHESVRDQIVEDVALMRVLKREGARVRLMLGQEIAATRMHTNLRQMFRGWARIFAGSSGRSVLPILATISTLMVTVVLLVVATMMAVRDGVMWRIGLATHAAVVLGFFGWIYRSARQSPLNMLALPVALPMVIVILAYALYVCRTGRVNWRGNVVGVNSKT